MGEKEDPVEPLRISRNPMQRLMYRAGWRFFHTLFVILWRRRAVGAENVPAEGPLLLAANHASMVDPPLVGSCFPRPIFFMGKEELFKIPLFGWCLRQVNAFPIRRKKSDVGAFRTAERILNAGGAMVVFPEGKRQKTGRLGPAKAGVGLLAKVTRAPVVPVYLHNTHRTWRLPRFTVIFGPALTAGENESAEEFSRRTMAAISAMKEAHFGPDA